MNARKRKTIVLTPKGERWLTNAYTVLVTGMSMIGFLAVLGLVGWIEGGMK